MDLEPHCVLVLLDGETLNDQRLLPHLARLNQG
jgi:hypothetical protein